LELDWKIAVWFSGKSNSKRLKLKNEIIYERGAPMKKGILLIISLAFTIFILSATGLTIATVSNLKSLQSSQVENALAVQNNSVLSAATPASSSGGNKTVSANVSPQTSIDEKTAIGIAQSDAGAAVLSGTNADLVDLDGHVAYEVIFDLGKVYVDANSGTVLSNIIQITPEIAIREASKVLQMNQVNRVDLGAYQGQNYYIVQFREGINAYVSMKGVVTFISNSQPSGQTHENND
jgi:uncharacterized membrane protein YkoI